MVDPSLSSSISSGRRDKEKQANTLMLTSTWYLMELFTLFVAHLQNKQKHLS